MCIRDSCSDELLGQLQWGAAQGRQLLEEQFGKASRQQLSDEQLLHFNQLLEEQLIKPSGNLPLSKRHPNLIKAGG